MIEDQQKFFSGKKIMYFVPHQDDEINMGGGLIYWLRKVALSVKVIYSTNGDYRIDAAIRMREAIESLRVLGVNELDIEFLGYSDQATRSNTHLYQTESWISRKGRTETYIPEDIEKDFPHLKVNSKKFTKENLITDISSKIFQYRPDIIFSVDFDSHADHRALSLCFDAAVGRVVKCLEDYQPVVYKQFAYPTNYKGYKDFYGIRLRETRFLKEVNSFTQLQNPYYSWDERVRFAIPEEIRTCNLHKNIVYQALKKYKSQIISSRVDRIINNDAIAWQRRTDNLLLQKDCKITVSSGNPNYLNDFMLFDCSDITNGNTTIPCFDKGIWIPNSEDFHPEIRIRFDNEIQIGEIVLYRSCSAKNIISRVGIAANDAKAILFENKTKDRVWKIAWNSKILIRELIISLDNHDKGNAGFSEIEIFKEKTENTVWSYRLFEDNIIYNETDDDRYSYMGLFSYNGYCGHNESNYADDTNEKVYLSIQNIYNLIMLKSRRAYFTFKRKLKFLLDTF